MEEVETYYLDTYALHEIVVGNSNYKPYTENLFVVTSKLNLMELYYVLLRDYGKKIAEEKYDSFLPYAINPEDHTIKTAMQFKMQNKEKNLSYVDCIGYTIAREQGAVFLTGDKEFKDLIGVEYVK